MPERCPLCGRAGLRAIYYAFPARVCPASACSCFWAHWSIEWLLTRLPYDGSVFWHSDEVGYLRGLATWFRSKWKGAER